MDGLQWKILYTNGWELGYPHLWKPPVICQWSICIAPWANPPATWTWVATWPWHRDFDVATMEKSWKKVFQSRNIWDFEISSPSEKWDCWIVESTNMGTEPATMEFQETDTLWENQATICSRYREYVNNKSGGVANKWVCPKLVNTPTTMETYEIKKKQLEEKVEMIRIQHKLTANWKWPIRLLESNGLQHAPTWSTLREQSFFLKGDLSHLATHDLELPKPLEGSWRS